VNGHDKNFSPALRAGRVPPLSNSFRRQKCQCWLRTSTHFRHMGPSYNPIGGPRQVLP